ncbi:MAG TPA: PAS domain S-box protein [Ilumatobacteraceae bacterium]|nr:PAS domain S-box protein [Ilumatobacteraceae bacterium]
MGVRSPLLKSYGDDFSWSLLDAAPDATMVVAGTGEIVFVNDHAGALFDCPPEKLLGLTIEALLPESARSIHRAHRTRYQAEPTVRWMATGLDLSALRFDGSLFPVEISLSPLRLGDDVYAVAAVRDITDRVESEDRLHRVLQTLDASDDAMLMFDADSLRYAFVNQGAVRLVGYSEAELLTMPPMHLNPYTCESDYRQLVSSLLSSDGSSAPVRQATMLRNDGTEVPVEKTYRVAPLGRDGHRWVIAMARDITTRLAAEEALRQSQQALHDAEQVLAIADDRERIARDLHDTVIQRLFGEGLRLLATMSTVSDAAKVRIQSTIDGLDQTIKELRLAVFSLQGGEPQPTGLRGRLLTTLTEATTGLGCEPRLQFEGPIETIDNSIAEQLIPVLREALSNVSRHAKAQSVRVSVVVDEDVTLTVSDDGIGVPTEVIGGNGISNMAERARRLKGNSSIVAQPEGGSMLTWRVPLPARSQRHGPGPGNERLIDRRHQSLDTS